MGLLYSAFTKPAMENNRMDKTSSSSFPPSLKHNVLKYCRLGVHVDNNDSSFSFKDEVDFPTNPLLNNNSGNEETVCVSGDKGRFNLAPFAPMR